MSPTLPAGRNSKIIEKHRLSPFLPHYIICLMAQNYLFVQTTPMSNLTLVPLEILTQIFGLLEGYQIARCGAVCSYFKRIVERSSGLQYLIKLDIFGYTDVSESVDAPASAITRLNRLERRIDAWNHLDWVESRIDAPLPSSDFGVICEGVFAMFDYRRVYCIQLPHLMRGIPFREWTLKKFSFPIHEIEIDPSNNLLVVVSMAVDHPDPPAVKTVTLHLRTLSDNSPHPRAISPILFSVRIDRGCPMIRVMGRLLGVTLCFRRELRVEIWDWTIGEKLTVVEDMRDLDSLIGSYCPFEFLSATSLVVIHQGVLEVYEIRVETPGVPLVHTASFCMPRPNLDKYCSTIWRTKDSHLSHHIDRGNLWERSSFPSPSFRLAENTCYLTIHWTVRGGPHFVKGLGVTFHVPVSSLRRPPVCGDALEIPWELWSRGVYFQNGLTIDYGISGERLIRLTPSLEFGLRCHVSLFDLNRSRASKLDTTNTNPRADYTPFHVIKSDVLDDEMRMERPPPVPLVTRSFSLDGFFYPPRVIYDDEHMVFWTPHHSVVPGPGGGGDEDGDEDEDVDYGNKLVILTML